MSGHNKWSKIKYVKAKEDAKKGKVFARFAHEIMLAAKSGGGDPDLNPRLRAAIDGAKAVSTPKENIERAIKKGTGELGGATIQEITYEGYGPSGTAFLIEVATDNTNRSASELRTLFTKNGGSIGTPGSVAYQFERKGEARIMAEGLTEDSAMDLALECGADDVIERLMRFVRIGSLQKSVQRLFKFVAHHDFSPHSFGIYSSCVVFYHEFLQNTT